MKPRTRTSTALRRRHERGLATVELALILPLLLAMLFGTVHFAGLFFLENNMQNASRDAARRLSVGELTAAQAQADIEAALANWPATFTVSITMPDPGDPDDRDIVVEVLTSVADAGLVDFISNMHPGNIRARVTMRQE